MAAVLDWFANGDDPVFRLFGYAGTGKTTMAQAIAEAVDGRVLFGAFTGKAAYVLQEKGCHGASTIHQMIYLPREKCGYHLRELQRELRVTEDEDRRRELQAMIQVENANLRRPAFTLNTMSEVQDVSLVLLDEVSMVGREMARDLLSFGTPVLALGDPAQLPPVGDGGYFTDAEPDYMLTEVHRHAEESGVLQLATRARHGQGIPHGDYVESRVVPPGTLSIEEVAAFDQVIVGRNNSRRILNGMIREHLGHQGHLPVRGDRLVCLRNDHEVGLLNGSQWVVVTDPLVVDDDTLELCIVPDGRPGEQFEVLAHRHYFEGREDQLAPWDVREAQAFDYGYALTCHKAQGSGWSNVMVRDEGHVFREHHNRWRYTAITRAAESVTVVR